MMCINNKKNCIDHDTKTFTIFKTTTHVETKQHLCDIIITIIYLCIILLYKGNKIMSCYCYFMIINLIN